jgi:hypothetical protein
MRLSTNSIDSSSAIGQPTNSLSDFTISTFREHAKQEVDASSLLNSKLDNLKRTDPFMYYSIPQNRDAELSGRAVEAASIVSSDVSAKATRTFSRRQRLSTECHPDVLLGLMDADEEEPMAEENLNFESDEDSYSIQVIQVPTFHEECTEEIDPSSLSTVELAALKTNNPFMYYSIPQLRDAELSGNDMDFASLASSMKNERSVPVSRKKRISTECHPDILFKDSFEHPLSTFTLNDVIPFREDSLEESNWDDNMLNACKDLFDES